MFKHILLPIDGSDLSINAAKTGIELAKLCGAQVHALHVVPSLQSFMYMSDALIGSEAAYIEQAIVLAAEYLARVQRMAEDAGVTCNGSYVVAERPHENILQATREQHCDLVVMASHGRRGLSRWLLGSETQKVLLQGEVPVLVCR